MSKSAVIEREKEPDTVLHTVDFQPPPTPATAPPTLLYNATETFTEPEEGAKEEEKKGN